MKTSTATVVSLTEEIQEPASLDDRIADAFESSLASADIEKLLAEVKQESANAKAESKAASALALDPRLRPADVAEARQKMQDADFRSTRLDVAAGELEALLEAAKNREAREAAQVEYLAAKSERDQLVKDLEEYPAIAEKLISLLDRLVASNARLEKANRGRNGAEWLRPAEGVARKAPENWEVNPTSDFPSLVQGVRLPNFRRTGMHGYAWPRYAY